MFRNISKQSRRRLRREELVRPGKTPQFMPTEGAEIAAIGASECLADHDRQIERHCHGLDPTDEVDRGADNGEIKPLGGLTLCRLLGDREDRQQAVTDELQYLGAPSALVTGRA